LGVKEEGNARKMKYLLSIKDLDSNRKRHRIKRIISTTKVFPIIPVDSDEGKKYISTIYAASNYGYANRVAITERIREGFKEVFKDESLKLELLYDVSHNLVQRELQGGEYLWVHRQGASRILPKEEMSHHPLFSKTGQPVPLPGSMSNPSYICVGLDGVRKTFFSINHGAGERFPHPKSISSSLIYNEVKGKGVQLFKFGRDDIRTHAPALYKNIFTVVGVMERLNLAKPIARLSPIAVLKG
jgi:tRNA-splicing ligase RtcB